MYTFEGALASQKVSDLLEPELQVVVSEPCNVGDGDQIRVLCESNSHNSHS